MSLRTMQMFVRSTDVKSIINSLRDYVAVEGKTVHRQAHRRLEGIERMLRLFVDQTRVFLLYSQDAWISIWEVVERLEFADPSIARFLSMEHNTDAMWVKLDEDFNIWAYQVFRCGKLIEERFLPESYWVRGRDEGDLCDYGSCMKKADKFEKKWRLSSFLVTLAAIKREPRKFKTMVKIICKLPEPTKKKAKPKRG